MSERKMKKIIFILLLLAMSLNAQERKYSISIYIQKTGITLEEITKLVEKYMKDGAEVTIQPVYTFNEKMIKNGWNNWFIQDSVPNFNTGTRTPKIRGYDSQTMEIESIIYNTSGDSLVMFRPKIECINSTVVTDKTSKAVERNRFKRVRIK